MLRAGSARIQSRDQTRRAEEFFQRFGINANVRFRGRLDLELRCLVRLGRELLRPGSCPTSLGWGRRLSAWRHGFHPLSAAVDGLEAWSPGLHPDLDLRELDWAHHTCRLKGSWNPIFTNKLVMARVLAARGVPHSPVLDVVAQGRRMVLGADPKPVDHDIARWMANGYRLVFRPQWSGGGKGVVFLSRDDPAPHRQYPSDPQPRRSGSPLHDKAVHRFGTAAHDLIDNSLSGRGLVPRWMKPDGGGHHPRPRANPGGRAGRRPLRRVTTGLSARCR